MKTVLVVGGTQGVGLGIATHYAKQGYRTFLTSRSADRAKAVAENLQASLGADITGLALDLASPERVTDSLSEIAAVDRIVLAGSVRDYNSLAEFETTGATAIVVSKLVGNPAVVSSLRERLLPDSAILLFGGGAKDYPYPGSTTTGIVNAGIVGLVRTMSVELAPTRVNAIHSGPIGDSSFWSDKESALDNARRGVLTGRLTTTQDAVDASLFLLENPAVNGVNLQADGGRA